MTNFEEWITDFKKSSRGLALFERELEMFGIKEEYDRSLEHFEAEAYALYTYGRTVSEALAATLKRGI